MVIINLGIHVLVDLSMQ